MIFYIIAGGPSYMDVTEEEWKYLEDKHTISFSRVPYGSRKTEYYFSIERDYLDKEVLTYMAKLGYTDTKLLLYIPESIKLARELGFNSIRKVVKQNFYFMPSRTPWFTDEDEPPHTFYETRAKNFHQPIFRFRGQLIAVINACIILGATEIRLIGVDLNKQKSFYQYPKYLNKICKDKGTIERYLGYDKEAYKQGINKAKKQYEDYDEKTMHTTNIPITEDRWNGKRLRGTDDTLVWIDKEMRKEGMEGIFITNKKSLLFNKLKFKEICK